MNSKARRGALRALGWFLLAFAPVCHSTSPVLDVAFGTGGTVVLHYPDDVLGGAITSIATQSDGSAVVAGSYGLQPIGRAGFPGAGVITRLDTRGSVDPAFFGGVIMRFPTPSVLAQPDGKILTGSANNAEPIVARYQPDGELDRVFTANATRASAAFRESFAYVSLALQADGKVLALGATLFTNQFGFAQPAIELLRFNPDGTLDAGFGTGGRANLVDPTQVQSTPGPTRTESAAGMVLLPNGKIALALTSFGATVIGSVVQLNADGALDSGFGINGRVSKAGEQYFAIAIQPSTAMLLVMRRAVSATEVIQIERLDEYGGTDNRFGVAGVASQTSASGPNPPTLLVQPDGSFLVLDGSRPSITRYNASGALDPMFGIGGVLTIPALKAIRVMLLGPDGALWLGGASIVSAPSQAQNGLPAVARVVDVPASAIEFYNASLDHYFISSNAQEISLLDGGSIKGWKRTGEAFGVLASAGSLSGVEPACRFYIPPALGDSHFFSASAPECGAVAARFPQFKLETSNAMRVGLPDSTTGACAPPMTLPVYRTWNARSDTNHRFTTNRVLRDTMLTRGWIAEGYGPDAVAMCAASR